jgi:hypothetical protein
VYIEVLDKQGGDYLSQSGWIEFNNVIANTDCAREFVHFMHERNFCNFLESAYNVLKKATE